MTDASGGVLPGVTVEATNTATGAVRTAVTGADGLYTIPLLAAGQLQRQGLALRVPQPAARGVRVTVTETARVTFQLEVGQLTETVTVVAEAPLVETSNATHGIVIDEQKVVDLPLNGRNFTQLGTLIPGVVAPPGGLGGQTGDATPGGFGNVTGGFNVNGMRNQSNNFLMDGATNNDTFNTGFVLRPPPDAIQEFKILTHAFGAEYGRNAGSVVNVVTKSGSNTSPARPGSSTATTRCRRATSSRRSTQPKPELKQNQFGAALGGPLDAQPLVRVRILRGLPQRQRHHARTSCVLSEAQRARRLLRRRGRFAIRSPASRSPATSFPSDRISPAAAQLLHDFVPLPNSPATATSCRRPSTTTRDQFGVRLDYQLGAASRSSAATCAATPSARRRGSIAPVDQRALATLQDVHGVAQLRHQLERRSTRRASRSTASPRIRR